MKVQISEWKRLSNIFNNLLKEIFLNTVCYKALQMNTSNGTILQHHYSTKYVYAMMLKSKPLCLFIQIFLPRNFSFTNIRFRSWVYCSEPSHHSGISYINSIISYCTYDTGTSICYSDSLLFNNRYQISVLHTC